MPHLPQSWNRYVYTLNGPVNLTDPSGRQCNPNDPNCISVTTPPPPPVPTVSMPVGTSTNRNVNHGLNVLPILGPASNEVFRRVQPELFKDCVTRSLGDALLRFNEVAALRDGFTVVFFVIIPISALASPGAVAAYYATGTTSFSRVLAEQFASFLGANIVSVWGNGGANYEGMLGTVQALVNSAVLRGLDVDLQDCLMLYGGGVPGWGNDQNGR